MFAAVLREYGGPEALKLENIPEPEIGDDEVLVRVDGCALNRIDVWFRTGKYKTNLPRVLGGDIAGKVERIGKGVRMFEVGQPVVVYSVISDGKCYYCMTGNRNRCLNVGFVGGVVDGGYAEYVKVKEDNLVPSENLDPEVAACLPVNFGTSLNAINSIGGLKPDETVFVMGASGGLGHAFVKLSKLFGAKIIASSSSTEKLAFLKRIGADFVINYKTEDVRKRVLELTNGIGVSVAFDHSGTETWGICLDVLKKGGAMITAGITTGENASVSIPQIYRKELRIHGVYSYTKEDLVKVVRLASDGKLRPEIFRTFKLSEIVEAHRLFDSGNFAGKILIKPK